MKIALLSEKYTPDIGGLAISTGRLGHLLDSVGHKVRVFAPSPNLPASEKQTLPSNGVSVTRFGAHKRADDTLVDWFELIVEEHKREPFDLIHAYFLPQAGFVGTYAGKYLNIPSVVSIRGNDIERAAFDPSKFSHVMYALQNASAVTTNASELAKKAKAFIDREIHLIPNGIDTERFKPMERNEMLAEAIGLRERKEERESAVSFRIGFVGELREKKGLATLLSGYTQVTKEMPVSLLIVGEIREGEDKKLFDEFRALNPEHRIVVTGHVPHKDLPAYYSLMDVFVHPSLRDGMPNAVLEAMACGKAVIATPVGGVLDVLEDGVNGRFTPVNDAEALAQEIEALLKDEQQRKQLGEQARKTIQTAFTPQRELEANLRIYNALVGK
ncbi:glycosyltransferase family 4 protein [Candidatus Villigracilis affinis]|uniref:glycosyltransferase family 4 protein n=1 Tax=Candidatus Villigracilis affinis TaxID=3140682 RepID=UPI001DEB79DB|nr:glycosyltransferase family 4 protein [Anaerolineales bacterium]